MPGVDRIGIAHPSLDRRDREPARPCLDGRARRGGRDRDALQTAILHDTLQNAGLTGPDQQAPASVHVQHGVNKMGRRLHYYFNYSSSAVDVPYGYDSAANLLDGKSAAKGSKISLAPWDLTIMEEGASAK